MQYNPELALKYGYHGDDEKIYRICCVWVMLSRKIFPDYRHSRIPQIAKLKNSILFKTIRKLLNERQFERLEEYVYFIRAQLMVLKNYVVNTGNPVLVEPVILTGEPSERRWFYWKKLVAQANNITRQTYTLQDSDMEFDLCASMAELKIICNDKLTYESFCENQNKIKTGVILRKIKPIYIYLSKWVKNLPIDIRKDLFKRSGAEMYDKCDTSHAEKFYNDNFKFES